MRKILTVLVLVLMLGLYANPTYALIQAFRLGSVGQDSVARTKCLTAQVAGADHYMTFDQAGVDYFAPSGYTFYITQIVVTGGNANGGAKTIGHGTDGVAAGAAAPSNPVTLTNKFTISTSGDSVAFSVHIPVPDGKYPYMQGVGSGDSIVVFGVEVAD